MKIGDYIMTPRFLTVKISAIFETMEEARAEGFTEPTHYTGAEYSITGKSPDINHMVFAAIKTA